MQLRPDRIGIARPELGEYYRDILCRDCDNKLGVFDDYAIDVCRAFKKKHTRDGKLFAILNVDGDKLAKFILAVLWRASISKRESFFGIRLGPYEPQARDVLFGAAPLSSLRAFQSDRAALPRLSCVENSEKQPFSRSHPREAQHQRSLDWANLLRPSPGVRSVRLSD